MGELSEKEEIKRLRILVDIYQKENEQLKYEYRVLHDSYTIKEKEVEQYKNSLSNKIINVIKQSLLYRLLRKIKHIFIKKGW